MPAGAADRTPNAAAEHAKCPLAAAAGCNAYVSAASPPPNNISQSGNASTPSNAIPQSAVTMPARPHAAASSTSSTVDVSHALEEGGECQANRSAARRGRVDACPCPPDPASHV